jgi:hypothetical protein
LAGESPISVRPSILGWPLKNHSDRLELERAQGICRRRRIHEAGEGIRAQEKACEHTPDGRGVERLRGKNPEDFVRRVKILTESPYSDWCASKDRAEAHSDLVLLVLE